MNRTDARALAIAALSLTVLFAFNVRAEQSNAQRAQPHVDAAIAAFDDEEYETALREYQAAREIIEEPMLTYNIAVCHERLGNLREAIDEFNRYLGEASQDARNRDDVEERIEDLHAARVEQRDAELDVDAADSARPDVEPPRISRRALAEARHEIDAVIGTTLSLAGMRPDAGNASLAIEADYFYRLTENWHVGGSFLYDHWTNTSEYGGADQKHIGVAVAGRYSHQFLDDRIEVRANLGFGWQYIHVRVYPGHWIFMRLGGTFAWDIIRGFGIHASANVRLGGIAGEFSEQNPEAAFAAGFDIAGGIFFAFGTRD